MAWYSLIQHLLLDDSTPDDESTYDVITRLRRSEEGCLDLRDVESLISPNTQPACWGWFIQTKLHQFWLNWRWLTLGFPFCSGLPENLQEISGNDTTFDDIWRQKTGFPVVSLHDVQLAMASYGQLQVSMPSTILWLVSTTEASKTCRGVRMPRIWNRSDGTIGTLS